MCCGGDPSKSTGKATGRRRVDPWAEVVPHYAWAGVRWLGIPAPVREAAARLSGRPVTAQGCGCVLALKRLFDGRTGEPAIEHLMASASRLAGRVLLAWWAIRRPDRDAQAWLEQLTRPMPSVAPAAKPGTTITRTVSVPKRGFIDVGSIVRRGGDVHQGVLDALKQAGAVVTSETTTRPN